MCVAKFIMTLFFENNEFDIEFNRNIFKILEFGFN